MPQQHRWNKIKNSILFAYLNLFIYNKINYEYYE